MNIRAQSDRRRGLLLVECLVYGALWLLVTGLAFSVFYKSLTQSTQLRRNVDDLTLALKVGERWRADIRRANGPIALVEEENTTHQALHIPLPEGEAVYYFTGTHVFRRRPGETHWIPLIDRLHASSLHRHQTEHTEFWRWEVELLSRKDSPIKRPQLTFQAVPAGGTSP